MINIVIPMAGRGKRFSKNEDSTPKPFIDVYGKPMFVRVIENFQHPEARFILIARSEDLQLEIDAVEDVKKKYNVELISNGLIVENSVEGIYDGMKNILKSKEKYKKYLL